VLLSIAYPPHSLSLFVLFLLFYLILFYFSHLDWSWIWISSENPFEKGFDGNSSNDLFNQHKVAKSQTKASLNHSFRNCINFFSSADSSVLQRRVVVVSGDTK